MALSEAGKAANWQDVSTQMPVFLLSGGSDVITLGGESVEEKQKMLRSLGLTDVRLKIYPGLRHSILRATAITPFCTGMFLKTLWYR